MAFSPYTLGITDKYGALITAKKIPSGISTLGQGGGVAILPEPIENQRGDEGCGDQGEEAEAVGRPLFGHIPASSEYAVNRHGRPWRLIMVTMRREKT